MKFEEGIEYLKEYVDKYNTAKVPYVYFTEDHIALGKWVSRQRELYHTYKLSRERINALEAVGFVWEVDHKAAQRNGSESSFNDFYRHLKDYKAEFGSCDVPQAYRCKDGYRLGAVVNKKRMRQERMSEEQKRKLLDLGFSFKSNNKPWNKTSILSPIDNSVLKNNIKSNLMEIQSALPGTSVLAVVSTEHCFHGYYSNDDSGIAVMIANLLFNYVKRRTALNETDMKDDEVAHAMIRSLFNEETMNLTNRMKNKIITGPFNTKIYNDQHKYAVTDKDHVEDSINHDTIVANTKTNIKKARPIIPDALDKIIQAAQGDETLAEDRISVICAAYPLTHNDFEAKEFVFDETGMDTYRRLIAGYIHAFNMCIKAGRGNAMGSWYRAVFAMNTMNMLKSMVIKLTEGATNEDLYYYVEKYA